MGGAHHAPTLLQQQQQQQQQLAVNYGSHAAPLATPPRAHPGTPAAALTGAVGAALQPYQPPPPTPLESLNGIFASVCAEAEAAAAEVGAPHLAQHVAALQPVWAQVMGSAEGAVTAAAAATAAPRAELERVRASVAELSAQLREAAAARDEALARIAELTATAGAHAARAAAAEQSLAAVAAERDALREQVDAAFAAAEDRVVDAERRANNATAAAAQASRERAESVEVAARERSHTAAHVESLQAQLASLRAMEQQVASGRVDAKTAAILDEMQGALTTERVTSQRARAMSTTTIHELELKLKESTEARKALQAALDAAVVRAKESGAGGAGAAQKLEKLQAQVRRERANSQAAVVALQDQLKVLTGKVRAGDRDAGAAGDGASIDSSDIADDAGSLTMSSLRAMLASSEKKRRASEVELTELKMQRRVTFDVSNEENAPRVDALQQMVAKVQSELDVAQRERSSSVARVAELEATLSAGGYKAEVQRERAASTVKIAELEAKLQSTRTEAEAESKLAAAEREGMLSGRLQAAEARLKKFEEASAATGRERAQSVARIYELETDVDEAKRKLRNEERDAADEVASLKRRLEEAELTHSQAASRARADTAAQLETVRAMAREEGQSEARSDVSSELEQARAAVAAAEKERDAARAEADAAKAEVQRATADARVAVTGAHEAAEAARREAAEAQQEAGAAQAEALSAIEEADGALSRELKVQLEELEARTGAERAAVTESAARYAAEKEAALAEAVAMAERAEAAEAQLRALQAQLDSHAAEVASSFETALREKDATIAALKARLATFEAAVAERDALLRAMQQSQASQQQQQQQQTPMTAARGGVPHAATPFPGATAAATPLASPGGAEVAALYERVRAASDEKEAAVNDITELVLTLCQAFTAAPSREGAALIERHLPGVPEAVLAAVLAQLRGEASVSGAQGVAAGGATGEDALAALLAQVSNAAADTMRRGGSAGGAAAMGSPEVVQAAHAAGVNLAAATAAATAPEVAALLEATTQRLVAAERMRREAMVELNTAVTAGASGSGAVAAATTPGGGPASTERLASAVMRTVKHQDAAHGLTAAAVTHVAAQQTPTAASSSSAGFTNPLLGQLVQSQRAALSYAEELEAMWDDIEDERTERRARRLSGISEQPGTEGELLIGELREDPELRQLFTKIDWARSGPKEIEAALGETGSTSSSLATVPSSPAAASVERLLGVKSAMQRDVGAQERSLSDAQRGLSAMGRVLDDQAEEAGDEE